MLKAGMKALIIGSRTKHGEQYIGCEVMLEQDIDNGDQVYAGTRKPFTVRLPNGRAFVVYREGLIHGDSCREMMTGYAIFSARHLMPIPPLEDPGIDECTFTPIVQKEGV